MLTLPMKDNRNRVVGAIQLINKCKHKTQPITSLKAADDQVVPYKQEDLNLSLSLASQASVALLNALHTFKHEGYEPTWQLLLGWRVGLRRGQRAAGHAAGPFGRAG